MKGWKTVLFGLLLAIGAPAFHYLAGVDWTAIAGPVWGPIIVGAIVIGLRAITTTPVGQSNTVNTPQVGVGPGSPNFKAIGFFLACGLGVLVAGQARASDVTPAKSSALSGFGIGTQCATTSCTGLYVGFNLAGIATNANVLGAGINGSLAAGGQNIGIQAGYQYWNGTIFFGPEVFADYTFGGSPVVAGYSAPKYLFGQVVKVGGPLASFFGGIAPASTAGVSNVLLSKTISPYLMIGAAERSWGTGLLAGAGATFDIDDHWFVDARYMNIQYTGSNQASPVQTVPQENIVLVGVNYKF